MIVHCYPRLKTLSACLDNLRHPMTAISRTVLPGEPAVLVYTFGDCPEVQAQWQASDLLLNLFITENAEKVMAKFRQADRAAQVHDFHRMIFPGRPIPALLKGKHDREDSGPSNQTFYLKDRTVPTTLAISWMTWGFSHNKRQAAERQVSREFAQTLLSHVLSSAGSVQFEVHMVGSRRGPVLANVKHPAGTVLGSNVWGASVRSRIRPQWNVLQLQQVVS